MVDLSTLSNETRILFRIPLKPLQGDRFQPTGFPSLGASEYQTADGKKLLVESAQSMANRMEAVCWDDVNESPVHELNGISHVTVTRNGNFLTDSMLESHRINSPYLLEGSDKTFFELLKSELGGLAEGPINRRKLAEVLFKYDVGSLIHGVFLAKKDLAGGRLRIARALSSFIEASNVTVAASGGVKNDHVNPSGDTKSGFGNVPFSRDEYVADEINLFVNIDLAQIRGYGLGNDATNLLTLLALYRVRKLLESDLRLRTACDLATDDDTEIQATRPKQFSLPSLEDLKNAVESAIKLINASKLKMVHTTVGFEDELKKGKAENAEEESETSEEESESSED